MLPLPLTVGALLAFFLELSVAEPVDIIPSASQVPATRESRFNQEEKRRFLRFVTSCIRRPLLCVSCGSITAISYRGFKEFLPNLSIRDAGYGTGYRQVVPV